MKNCILLLLCVLTLNVSAQVKDTAKKKLPDTIKKDIVTVPDTLKKLQSTPLALIPPAVLVAYGASSFFVNPVRRLDFYIQGRYYAITPHFSTTAESYFLFTPIVMVYGLNLVGIEGKNRFIDRTAILGLSAGILGITEEGLKYATHRRRPNLADYYSFPSGHTGAAFLGAEYLAQEFGFKSPIYTVIGYTCAFTTAIFRMANRDHWFSDVVAGAGFGILSTKAAYLVYPSVRKIFVHTTVVGKKTTMLIPTIYDGKPGISFAMGL